jgi:hypothetical protein
MVRQSLLQTGADWNLGSGYANSEMSAVTFVTVSLRKGALCASNELTNFVDRRLMERCEGRNNAESYARLAASWALIPDATTFVDKADAVEETRCGQASQTKNVTRASENYGHQTVAQFPHT